MNNAMSTFRGRRSCLNLAIMAALTAPLAGCLGGGGGSDDDSASGVFVDSPVAGLNYSGTRTAASTTSDTGEFVYRGSETVTFAIGDLVLGSAPGGAMLTPLDIVSGAVDASDQRVTNMLVLLQTLDADGDLNNGIQLTEQIRSAVSAVAGQIELDQSAAEFRTAIADLIDDLEADGAFSDTDPRPRAIVEAADARAHFARSSGPRVEVDTTGGTLRGFEASADAWQFLGVPYAKPPLGELRWRPPQAAEPWDGVRDAVDWADQSAQDYTLERVNEGGMSEDSLYLNVTTPKDADNLPVMVWFHGGSFAILSANSNQYNNPQGLTEKDVVLVTVNHRLGPFGYIAHPLLTAESGYNGSGNYGQMDLVMALQWVQDNIAAFGGDPGNVTIFGQSGGGGKVYSLMNSPQAIGLFHKAIVQSGFAPLDTTGEPGDSLAESEAIGAALFARAGVESLEEARALPWTAFAKADLDNSIPRQTYRPNVDYYYQPKTYYQNVLDGMPSDVPLMAGVTNGDYTTLRAAMPIWLQQRSARYESDQFIYRFSRVPPGWAELGLTSCHGCELPYLFNYPAAMVQNYLLGLVLTPQGQRPPIGDLNGNGVSGTQGDSADIYASMRYGAVDMAVAEETLLQWTNFAKTGNPSTDAVSWTAYTLDNDALMEMGADGTARMVKGTTEAP